MSQEEIKAEVTRQALELCKHRIQSGRLPAPPEMMASIQLQLEWLLAYFEGRSNERGKLNELLFGHFAARELDQSDQELISALHKAFYVASQTAKGLKSDLKVLGVGS